MIDFHHSCPEGEGWQTLSQKKKKKQKNYMPNLTNMVRHDFRMKEGRTKVRTEWEISSTPPQMDYNPGKESVVMG